MKSARLIEIHLHAESGTYGFYNVGLRRWVPGLGGLSFEAAERKADVWRNGGYVVRFA